MSCTLQNIVNSDSVDNYYYAAYAANAKIALGSAQLNKMLANSTFLDLPFTLILLKEVIEYLQSVENLLQARPTHTHHTEHALYYLCQSIDAFSRSCKHLVKTATETKREMNNDPFKTPPRLDTNDFDIWTDVLNQTKQTLKQCTLIMAAGINLAKTKQATAKRAITISQSYVETMILLSQMQFKVHDNSTYKQAYEYLIKAEKMCSDTLYHQGFGYLASAYYNLGKMMIQANKHSEATSALKNSIQLLERDVNRANTTSGKLHLCKRYELYGVCCQAARRMDEAIHAYRTAMQRIPTAALKSFASKHDTTSPSTRMTEEGFLTNIIEKYLAVSVADPTAQSNVQIVADNFPSMSDFPIIQQCFILESELKVCGKLSSKMDLLSHQQVIIDRLLKMYDRRTYPIRRAR
ncbi:hypothetical protein BDF20DRAFT_819024 [Mycotypha africana]|uniref:uncharacterized protein n=1 Tax=Mycotypha africana TaxID=64632 RepID=UPI0022FFDEC5|nr:uncharacterized protein BDF20DRAFT_819024 [Mycotypha africana]KAI8979430.1 hypothetical protein BDF20DRAFT_819024 [Mycotypha africana]